MGWRQVEFPLLVITAGGGFTGLFVYGPGAPRSGNLLYSIAATQGTDPFGNPFFQGGCAYFGAAGTAAVAQMVGDNFALFNETFPPLNKAGLIGVSAGAAFQAIVLTSGRISTDTPSNISLYSGTPGLLSGSPQVVINAGINGSNGGTVLPLEVVGGIASNPAAVGTAFQAQIRADSQPRWLMDSNGGMNWGPGGGTVTDTTFFRQGAGNLQTNGSLTASASLNCFASVGIFKNNDTNIALFIQTLFDANNRFQIDDQGKHSWGPGGATAVDTDLFRSAAGVLRTDNSMEIGNTLNIPQNAAITHFGVDNTGLLFLIAGSVGTTLRAVAQVVGDTQNRWQIDANGKQSWGPGGGTVPDTDLYRQAASELKTDGQFDASIFFGSTKLVLANQGSAPATIAGDTQMVGSNADQMFTVGGNGTSGFLPVANSDPTLYTVTTATLGQFSKVWNVPAGAANAGATYELKAFGHGKQGSTAQAPTISFMLNGGVLFTAVLPAAFANINANFGLEIEAKIMIFTTGVAGTMWVEMNFSASGSLAIGAILAAQNINTTIANTFGFDANWGAVVGAPTMTSNGNYFLKVA